MVDRILETVSEYSSSQSVDAGSIGADDTVRLSVVFNNQLYRRFVLFCLKIANLNTAVFSYIVFYSSVSLISCRLLIVLKENPFEK